MAKPLTKNDLDVIAFSLQETIKRFAAFEDAPSAEYQERRVREIEKLLAKVRALRQELD